ncbi:hypothetical protein [Pseudomonas antarctica]|uniref:hypothetical protein n=1 Tax=Pseudomonas antarctica TaxID=219572 RepID=UPI00387A83F8
MAGNAAEGVREVGAAWGADRSENKVDYADTSKEAVSALLKALDEAQKTSKNQTVQHLRDKLNEKRAELGDEKFKAILEQLWKDAAQNTLMLLKALFPELFASEPSPAPSPRPSPGGGGGHGGGGGGGGRVNPSDFGSREFMSNKPFTAGARYTDYKPDKSNPGKKPGMGREAGNIWSGFKQASDGNCVTVSAIKAAMMKFGQKATDVFRDVRTAGDGWNVQMRDGKTYHLSRGELKVAAEQARFAGDDPAMITEANFMYAVSAKRAQTDGNNRGGRGENDHKAQNSFQDALLSLNDGEHDHEGLDRLGLSGLYRQTTSDELASGALGIVNYGHHSMAVIGGSIELWGGRGGRPGKEDNGEAYAFI